MSSSDSTYIEEAIKCFNTSLQVSNNQDGEAFFNLGNIYKKLGKHDKAINFYEEALKHLKPHEKFQVYINLGLSQRDNNNYEQSIVSISKAC